jgi:hypothetical protein
LSLSDLASGYETLMVRSASSRVSNHEDWMLSSFETWPSGRSSSDNGEAVAQG